MAGKYPLEFSEKFGFLAGVFTLRLNKKSAKYEINRKKCVYSAIYNLIVQGCFLAYRLRYPSITSLASVITFLNLIQLNLFHCFGFIVPLSVAINFPKIIQSLNRAKRCEEQFYETRRDVAKVQLKISDSIVSRWVVVYVYYMVGMGLLYTLTQRQYSLLGCISAMGFHLQSILLICTAFYVSDIFEVATSLLTVISHLFENKKGFDDKSIRSLLDFYSEMIQVGDALHRSFVPFVFVNILFCLVLFCILIFFFFVPNHFGLVWFIYVFSADFPFLLMCLYILTISSYNMRVSRK